MVKQNWFNTLNEALESEGLLDTWDISMGSIGYGESARYVAMVRGDKRFITIYRETDGRYERPVHYLTQMDVTNP